VPTSAPSIESPRRCIRALLLDEAEVENLDLAGIRPRTQSMRFCGLDVSMNEANLVRLDQRAAGLLRI